MNPWKEVSLEEVAEINPSETLKKRTLAKKISMEALQPFCKVPTSFVLEEYNGGMKFRNGDTLIARITPCLENGKTAYVDILEDNEVAFGSTEYIVVREKTDSSDKQFLYYFSVSPIFREVAILSMTGSSGRQRVQTDVVKKHLFEIPPLQEQKAIASVLSSLDDKIDLLHRQNKTLEAMAETLFRQWFVEEAQEDWDIGKVEDLFVLQRGFDLPVQNRKTGKYPIFASSGLSGYHSEYRVSAPGITTGRSGILGNVFLVLEDFWPLNTSLYIKEFRLATPIYAYFALKNMDLHSFNAGSAVPTLNRNHVHEESVLLPPRELIQDFDRLAFPMFSKKKENESQIAILEKLRDTLLPKLMNGEVRVVP